jgi:hypothetical protein
MFSYCQTAKEGSAVTVYFGCVPKGRLQMPYSLKEIHEKVKHSKVKLFHGEDLELQVHSKSDVETVLHSLDCPVERMQAQEAPRYRRPGDPADDDLYSYRRGDIPMFNFDDMDKVLISTLQVRSY